MATNYSLITAAIPHNPGRYERSPVSQMTNDGQLVCFSARSCAQPAAALRDKGLRKWRRTLAECCSTRSRSRRLDFDHPSFFFGAHWPTVSIFNPSIREDAPNNFSGKIAGHGNIWDPTWLPLKNTALSLYFPNFW